MVHEVVSFLLEILLLFTQAHFLIRFLGTRAPIRPWMAYLLIGGLIHLFPPDFIPIWAYPFHGALDLAIFAFVLLLTMLLLDGSIVEKLFCVLFLNAIDRILNFFYLTLCNLPMRIESLDDLFTSDVMDVLVFSATVLWHASYLLSTLLVLYCKEKKHVHFGSFEWLLFACHSYAAIYVLNNVLKVTYFDPLTLNYFQIGALTGMLVLSGLALFLMWRFSHTNAERKRLVIDKMQLEQYRTQLACSEKQYLEMQQLRHDMKNHLQCIAAYLRTGETARAETYISDILQSRLPLGNAGVHTGHRGVDIIVSTKLSQCSMEGIGTTVQISPFSLVMEDIDACIILGNLLDNAIEACRNTEGERLLYLDMRQRKQYVNIVIRNTISQSVLETNPDLHTTKENGRKHGLGLRAVRGTVEKYGGMIDFCEENQEFIADVWLPCGV
ncbi:MAG: GHKL domain-containing protein [Oscillospiraceae bacterium]|nr:GHKL domain-containing protein [Oscillospiraceae bacterium]